MTWEPPEGTSRVCTSTPSPGRRPEAGGTSTGSRGPHGEAAGHPPTPSGGQVPGGPQWHARRHQGSLPATRGRRMGPWGCPPPTLPRAPLWPPQLHSMPLLRTQSDRGGDWGATPPSPRLPGSPRGPLWVPQLRHPQQHHQQASPDLSHTQPSCAQEAVPAPTSGPSRWAGPAGPWPRPAAFCLTPGGVSSAPEPSQMQGCGVLGLLPESPQLAPRLCPRGPSQPPPDARPSPGWPHLAQGSVGPPAGARVSKGCLQRRDHPHTSHTSHMSWRGRGPRGCSYVAHSKRARRLAPCCLPLHKPPRELSPAGASELGPASAQTRPRGAAGHAEDTGRRTAS